MKLIINSFCGDTLYWERVQLSLQEEHIKKLISG